MIKNINSKLSTNQKELFGHTFFGPFPKLPEFKYQAQLLHHLFLKYLIQPNLEEMWFSIGNKIWYW